jgi:hypothetical protein
MPGTNYLKDKREVKSFTQIYHLQNGNEEIIFSPSQGKKKISVCFRIFLIF